ncbi:MAG: ImmA/IrrE family metallo-endopeptidase [Pyrinomonadaceae bacterium]
MLFSRENFSNLKIGWNERPLTETDFYKLCRRFKITVDEIPLRVSGFYYCVMGRHFIAIDSKLPPKKKLFVMFHEFAHFLMHAPNTNETASYHGLGRQTRKEREADMFALVALIPRDWLTSRTPDELIADEGFSADELRQRFALFENFGV